MSLKSFVTANPIVNILRRCCLEFRELFREVTDVDPFAQSLTIASACNLVFRKTFLIEHTIAVIPPCGYKLENKESVITMKMLAWIVQSNNIAICHARNHGEQRIGKYPVDGYNAELSTVGDPRMHVAWMHQMLRSRHRTSCQPPDNARPSPANVRESAVPQRFGL